MHKSFYQASNLHLQTVQLTLSSELVPQLQNETGALEISFEEGSWIG